MNFIRNIYDWVINLSKKPNGGRSLAIISFSEASTLPTVFLTAWTMLTRKSQ